MIQAGITIIEDEEISVRKLKDRLVSADIHTEILGSDHCPVELVLK